MAVEAQVEVTFEAVKELGNSIVDSEAVSKIGDHPSNSSSSVARAKLDRHMSAATDQKNVLICAATDKKNELNGQGQGRRAARSV